MKHILALENILEKKNQIKKSNASISSTRRRFDPAEFKKALSFLLFAQRNHVHLKSKTVEFES